MYISNKCVLNFFNLFLFLLRTLLCVTDKPVLYVSGFLEHNYTILVCYLKLKLIYGIWPYFCQAKANEAKQDTQTAHNMENVPLTEVPLLAGKDCIFEVVGDTVFERPTVYYNICQVWITRWLPYGYPKTSFGAMFLSLCHKEVLNEHFLWFFHQRSVFVIDFSFTSSHLQKIRK